MESLKNEVMRLQSLAELWSADEVLRWGLTRFSTQVAVASSFGVEDVVLIDVAARVRSDFRVFTLDTDFLFPETYALIGEVERRYGISVERCRAKLSPEAQASLHGPALWSREPDRCCQIRKVLPLEEKLAGFEAWITGIRREQAPTRADSRKIEWDEKFGLVKLNPLVDWTWTEIWDYIRAHGVPFNPLHEQNYPSIGCTHCTRPVKAGEDLRAGRWSGFRKTECGLHAGE